MSLIDTSLNIGIVNTGSAILITEFGICGKHDGKFKSDPISKSLILMKSGDIKIEKDIINQNIINLKGKKVYIKESEGKYFYSGDIL